MAIAAPTTSVTAGPRADDAVGSRRRPLTHLFLLFPAIAILLFGMGYPVVWQVVTSFQKYGAMQQLGGKAPEFVGLDNYIAIATSPTFWAVAVRSDRLLHRHGGHHRRHRHAAGRAHEQGARGDPHHPPGRLSCSPGRCRSSLR